MYYLNNTLPYIFMEYSIRFSPPYEIIITLKVLQLFFWQEQLSFYAST